MQMKKTLPTNYTDYKIKKFVLTRVIRGPKKIKEVKNDNKSKSQCSPFV
jgi:hypothetical protein